MGFFNNISEQQFKKDEAGNTVYYPRGAFGKGYVITSDEQMVKARKLSHTLIIAGFAGVPALLLCVMLLGWLSLIVIIPLALLAEQMAIKSVTRTSQASNKQFPLVENIKTNAVKFNIGILIFGAIMSVLFVIGCAFVIITEPQSALSVLGGLVIFGASSVMFIYMLIVRFTSKA